MSGNSSNCAKALEWARASGLRTDALVGTKRGRMTEIAEQVIGINETHYGRVEDAEMGICHLLCFAFTNIRSGRNRLGRSGHSYKMGLRTISTHHAMSPLYATSSGRLGV